MLWVGVAVAILSGARDAAGHPAPFSYLDLQLEADGIQGALVLHDYDVAHDLGISDPATLRDPTTLAARRDILTRLIDARLVFTVDGRRATIRWRDSETLPERQSVRLTFSLDADRPGSVRVEALLFPYDPVHQTFLNVYESQTLRQQSILDAQRRSTEYFAGSTQGSLAVVRTFIAAGIEHILIGPDHVLFLIGLLLLGGSLWRLAGIVTAFTVGHSITLSLAALDIMSPPASVIEPAIALSIIFIGADNVLVQREKQGRDIRAYVAGVFGLVHGFGFAFVLREFGLPGNALTWSLFSFNVGVEIGQLVVVLIVATVLAAIRRRNPQLGDRLALMGSIIVIGAGGYWFIERVFLVN